jgi:RimJ/RimL family protein N-acetyltransferase
LEQALDADTLEEIGYEFDEEVDGAQVIETCSTHSFNEQWNAAKIGCLLNSSYWGQSLMRDALEVGGWAKQN